MKKQKYPAPRFISCLRKDYINNTNVNVVKHNTIVQIVLTLHTCKENKDLAVIAGAVGGRRVTTLPWPKGDIATQLGGHL